MSKTRGHIYEIHFLRAFACLCVLLVHVSASFFNANGQQFNEFTYFFNQISRFGTPIFAVISGFLLVYQTKLKGFDFKKFVSSRFTKIGLPFLFWSIFYLAFTFATQGINPFDAGTDMFLANFAFGHSFYHLYFMSIVFQFYLIYPLLQVFRSKLSWILLLTGAILINLYFLTSYRIDQFSEVWQVILNPGTLLLSWIFFFIFGGFLAHFWEPLASFSKRHKKLLGIAAALITILAVVEYKITGSIGASRPTNFINIPIITLFVMGVAEDIQKVDVFNRFFTKIGTLSMAIYLVHPFALSVFRAFAPEFVWNSIMFPLVFVIILLGSLGMVKFIQLFPLNQYILTVPKINKRKVQHSVKQTREQTSLQY
jgi:probable poly-beta-1,6-N-acetyl-D-glucosamine export protein